MSGGCGPLPLSLVILIIQDRLDVSEVQVAEWTLDDVARSRLERGDWVTVLLYGWTDDPRSLLISTVQSGVLLEPSKHVVSLDKRHLFHLLWSSSTTFSMHPFCRYVEGLLCARIVFYG